MNRAGFMQFILEQYSVEPDYPWMKNPNFAVFRHSNNQKWFALIMDIQGAGWDYPVTNYWMW